MNVKIEPIQKEDILNIIPLVQKINVKTPLSILEKRFLKMAALPHYECIGMFIDNKLIGVTGLWYSVRHYIGKSVEPDHVVIDEAYRGKNLGKQLFEWVYTYTKSKGYEAVELNTYTGNTKSHKFYYNEGFNIYGFHFLKVIRNDERFY
ncbi:MAG: GNAT family N-acetyltransferase [Flavobacteriaceae bacterium]|nr:GNAT family N-acetyltransferase [Flavobacteriaceae bacterium]